MKLRDKLKKRLQVIESDRIVQTTLSKIVDDLVDEYNTQNMEIVSLLEEIVETDKKFEKLTKKYLPDGFRQRCIDALMAKKTQKNGIQKK